MITCRAARMTVCSKLWCALWRLHSLQAWRTATAKRMGVGGGVGGGQKRFSAEQRAELVSTLGAELALFKYEYALSRAEQGAS